MEVKKYNALLSGISWFSFLPSLTSDLSLPFPFNFDALPSISLYCEVLSGRKACKSRNLHSPDIGLGKILTKFNCCSQMYLWYFPVHPSWVVWNFSCIRWVRNSISPLCLFPQICWQNAGTRIISRCVRISCHLVLLYMLCVYLYVCVFSWI